MFFRIGIYTIKMARLTPKQHTENLAQHFRFVRQHRLVNHWQTRIGITNISQLGKKQLHNKSKQLSILEQAQIKKQAILNWKQASKKHRQAQRQQQRQKRNQAILLRKQRQDQVCTSGPRQ